MKQQSLNSIAVCALGLIALVASASIAPQSCAAASVQAVFDYQSTVSHDTQGPLDLKAELNYDAAGTAQPIAVVMHGYSPTTGNFANVRENAERLRDRGFFVVSVAMRGRDGSDGTRDSGGVEIHDIYDAVEAVKQNFSNQVDATNVHITGYSGGGGNVMSALTKFPDYFRAGSAFFGMSDYGFDPATGWYQLGASAGHRAQLVADIGNPLTGGPAVRDAYHARASHLAARNNPYSEIHLFVNSNETTCPPPHSLNYRDQAVAAASSAGEFDNITVHLGAANSYHDFNGDGLQTADERQYWPHGFLSADQQRAGESWYLDRVLAGDIPQPTLQLSDELFVAGYVKTKPFGLWLGDGQNAAGILNYDLADDRLTFDLEIVSLDASVTGGLMVDLSRWAGRDVQVLLNGQPQTTFTAQGAYQFDGLGHNQTLEIVLLPEPTSATCLIFGGMMFLLRKRR